MYYYASMRSLGVEFSNSALIRKVVDQCLCIYLEGRLKIYICLNRRNNMDEFHQRQTDFKVSLTTRSHYCIN